ncbi:MAG: GHKL domain-containing protein [Proteobacteria bacterium]|nr:GHKL domain-containing protein [Pseudomonadota bacterium]
MAELQWLFVVLAFVAAVAGAFVLGSWRERARGEHALQRSRCEAAAWRQLQHSATWQSDATHTLSAWQAAPGDTTPRPDASALARVLAAQRPFRGLRLGAASDAGSPPAWELDGEPVRDASGALVGYCGSARPASQSQASRLAGAALGGVLLAWPGPMLVAVGEPARQRVTHANDAARALWPHLCVGTELGALRSALPAALAEALAVGDAALEALADDAEGWRVSRFALEGERVGWLLGRVAPAAAQSAIFGPTLSHDLRAPIRVVEGFTRIVKEDHGHRLDRLANEHLDRVLAAATRMNLMIDALLALARLSAQPLARQRVDLSQLAGHVVDELRRGTPQREVDVEIEPALTARGDPTLLRTVLENLLGNAWKYTARVPHARVTLRRREHEGRTCFEVADNGVGFDMRSADRLFGLFQRLHSQADFPGHGVGLASAQQIVQRHGGQIWVHAEPGRGAAFRFTLA